MSAPDPDAIRAHLLAAQKAVTFLRGCLCSVLVDVHQVQTNEDFLSAVSHLRDIETELDWAAEDVGDRETAAP